MPCEACPVLNSGKCFQRLRRHSRRAEFRGDWVMPPERRVFPVDTGHSCPRSLQHRGASVAGVSCAPLSHHAASWSCFGNYTNRWTVSITRLLLGDANPLTAFFFSCWSASGLQGIPGSQWHSVGPFTTSRLLLSVDCCSGL